MVSLDEMRSAVVAADIVVLALPLTEQTRGLLGREFFLEMKEGSLFVNVARGAIVEMDALMEGIKEKSLTAILDVFEEEPLDKDSPLWNMERVIITPHNSFVGDGVGLRLSALILFNLKECIEGEAI